MMCYIFGHAYFAVSEKEYDGWDYSEPQERQGDYLPTKWKEYMCKCGTKKRIYFDGFTHLGVLPPRTHLQAKDTPKV